MSRDSQLLPESGWLSLVSLFCNRRHGGNLPTTRERSRPPRSRTRRPGWKNFRKALRRLCSCRLPLSNP